MQNSLMICPNCGSQRQGPYCGQCGQNDRNYQRALPPLLSELLRETFEIDSRLIHTLSKLLLHPGELAVEFSNNRRASYVSPIRLYLFVSIAFFFLLSLGVDTDVPEAAATPAQAEAVAGTDLQPLLHVLDADQQAKVLEIAARPETSIARMAVLELARSVASSADAPGELELYVMDRMIETLYEPRTALDHLLDNLPIAVFIMLPIYALLLKLFYLGQHRYYVETLVFATHLHTFAFIVFTALLVLPTGSTIEWVRSLAGWASSLLWIGFMVYHYLALKRYYGGSHATTLLKFTGLTLLYTALLMPTAVSGVVLFTLATL
jgi:hypothetical protein